MSSPTSISVTSTVPSLSTTSISTTTPVPSTTGTTIVLSSTPSSSIATSASISTTLPSSSASLSSFMSSTASGTLTISTSSSSSSPSASSSTVSTTSIPPSSSVSSSTSSSPPSSSASPSSPPPPSSTTTVLPPSTSVEPPPSTTTSATSTPPPPSSSAPPPPSPPPPPDRPPVSTVVALTTFESTVFVQTTNSVGLPISIAPATITSTFITTESNGSVTTITQIGVNPTLSPDTRSPSSDSFFRKTGAVAGVFSLVGLAAAAILLWIVIAVRRHRWRQQLEHDSATSAALAAAGFHRAPLDDEDDGLGVTGSRFSTSHMEMTHRSSSGYGIPPPATFGNGAAFVPPTHDDPPSPEFNPYNGFPYPAAATSGGYVPARTSSSSPPPTASAPPPGHSSHGSHASLGEPRNTSLSASNSAGSTEPLLAPHRRSFSISNSPPSYFATFPAGPPPPPRNPKRLTDSQRQNVPEPETADNPSLTSVYSDNDVGDERLDPAMKQKLAAAQGDQNSSERDLRDDEDYSRPVLSVRNVPDT